MTKVEQVARAIATAGWKVNGDERFNADDAYDLTNNSGRFAFDEMARAAIQAMRELTQHMRDAVEKAEDEGGYVAAAYEHIDWDDAWPIAIDAALSETSEES
jgi:hypothetical protein